MKIAVLMTVHNRRDKTLKCLEGLKSQILSDSLIVDIYITDDGSTDGTDMAIRERYPDVKILLGDGSLFWNRGMRKAWVEAAKHDEYDCFLWLNDDTYLFDDTLSVFINCSVQIGQKGIIIGATTNNSRSEVTYGGMKDGRLLSPDGTLQDCTTFNGNVVLVSRHAFEQIGFLDPYYVHAIGDIDYGLMARTKGVRCVLTPKYIGICEKNPRLPDWVCPDIPFSRRWKNFHSPLGYGEPRAFFHFNRKHFGIIKALNVYIRNHIRLFFPSLWNRIIIR
jgi:GT2 family glycosyltransferase